ncbi:MAG: hypothetical protein HY568_04555, partial [Candidatus Latescibacteria bacterium]|nr:hypothetical protein [Candidatus Latescibacterota bacterium]
MRQAKCCTIGDIGEDRPPAERLLDAGPGILTDADLVSVLLGAGLPRASLSELS